MNLLRTSGVPLLILSVLFACAVYALHAGDYLIFDSYTAIDANASLKIDGSVLDEWRSAALSTTSGPLRRPLSMLSFAANHVLSGTLSPLQIKITNALIHCLTGLAIAWLLFVVASASPALGWGRERALQVAAVAGSIWLLHPLQVSTVLYAVQRMTQLSALFVVLGLAVFFVQRRRWLQRVPTVEQVSGSLLWLAIFTLLAAFSKENGLLLPWLAAVTEMWLFGYVVAGRRAPWLRLAVWVMLLLPVLAVALLFLFDPDWAVRAYANREFSLGTRLLTQVWLLWQYLGWMLLPWSPGMGFFHDDIVWSQSLMDARSLIAMAAWLLLLVMSWRWRSSFAILGFAVCWYLVAHSMESTILPLEMVFEHRNYLAMIGPIALFASLLCSTNIRFAQYRPYTVALVIVLLAATLFQRSANWRSETLLAESSFAQHPQSLRSHFLLASRYQQEGLAAVDPARAQRYFAAARELAQRALALSPDSVPALVLLAYFDGNSSDPAGAEQWYTRLEATLGQHPLSTSDVKFLEFQNRCVLAGDCLAPRRGQLLFLQNLEPYYRSTPILHYQLVSYCLAMDDLDCTVREAELLLAQHPDSLEALEALYAAERLSGRPAQEAVRRILLQDTERRMVSSLLRNSRRDS